MTLKNIILILIIISQAGCTSVLLSEPMLARKSTVEILQLRKSFAKYPNLYADEMQALDTELDRRGSADYLNP